MQRIPLKVGFTLMYSFKNVDVIEALRNIVKLNTENYQSDFNYDVLRLKTDTGKDYFCFMTRESGTWLFNEEDVYRVGSHANTTWKCYANNAENVKVYAVEVTDRSKDSVYGNIYEMDYIKSLEDIKANEKPIQYVDIVYDGDKKLRVDYVTFNSNYQSLALKLGNIKSYSYVAKDEEELSYHLKINHSMREKQCKPFDIDRYINSLNSSKLAKAGYKKDDMYCVSADDAVKLVKNTNIPVYQLNTGEAQSVTLDVIYANKFQKPLYGIKFDDKERFDIIDRKERAAIIKQYEIDKDKNDKLSSYGYTGKDMYPLYPKEIEKAFNNAIPVVLLGKGDKVTRAFSLEEAKEYVRKKGMAAIHINYKDTFLNINQNKGIAGRVANAKKKAAEQSNISKIVNIRQNER